MAENNNERIAREVLAAVGGKDNVVSVTHCMTRLRFNLKKDPDVEDVKKINGVVGVVNSGGQFQVIIGTAVAKVYDAVVAMGITGGGAIDENLDDVPAEKEKLTFKKVGNNILNYVAGSVTPLLPVMIGASLFSAVNALLGTNMLKVLTPDSSMYIIFDFLYDAFFYFLPIFVGYTASKKLNLNPVLGAFIGAMLLSPDFVTVVANKTPLAFFGVNVPLLSYKQSLLPVLLGVWVMKYVYHFFNKHMPEAISTILTPFLTMLVMAFLMFCFIAPLGSNIAKAISSGLVWLGTNTGPFGVAIIAGLWPLLIIAGMHLPIIMLGLAAFMEVGYDTTIMLAVSVVPFASWGISLAAAARLKNKDDKAMAIGYFISAAIGGVTEPATYGIALRYKKPLLALCAGTFTGAFFLKLMGVVYYTQTSSNFLRLLCYVGGDGRNVVLGITGCVITAVVAFLLTWFFGFTKEDIEGNK